MLHFHQIFLSFSIICYCGFCGFVHIFSLIYFPVMLHCSLHFNTPNYKGLAKSDSICKRGFNYFSLDNECIWHNTLHTHNFCSTRRWLGDINPIFMKFYQDVGWKWHIFHVFISLQNAKNLHWKKLWSGTKNETCQKSDFDNPNRQQWPTFLCPVLPIFSFFATFSRKMAKNLENKSKLTNPDTDEMILRALESWCYYINLLINAPDPERPCYWWKWPKLCICQVSSSAFWPPVPLYAKFIGPNLKAKSLTQN